MLAAQNSLAALQQLAATDSSNLFHGIASAQFASCAANTITPITVIGGTQCHYVANGVTITAAA